MTHSELQALKVGDNVRFSSSRGRVTMSARTWVMVMWEDGFPEIIRRRGDLLTSRMELDVV